MIHSVQHFINRQQRTFRWQTCTSTIDTCSGQEGTKHHAEPVESLYDVTLHHHYTTTNKRIIKKNPVVQAGSISHDARLASGIGVRFSVPCHEKSLALKERIILKPQEIFH